MSKSVDVPEGMKKIIEEREQDALDEEAGRSTPGLGLNPKDDDDSSLDIEQLHKQIQMFSKNIDELKDYTK